MRATSTKEAGCGFNMLTVGYLTWLNVFLVLLTPIVSELSEQAKVLPIVFYSLMTVAIVLVVIFEGRTNYLPVILAILLLLVAASSQGAVKGLAYAATFYLAYRGIEKHRSKIFSSVISFAAVNYIIMLGQLSGHLDILFSWVNYSNVADPVPIFSADEVPAIYLPQIRPSGLFPTTTYMSVFCIMLFSFALFEIKTISKYSLVFIGSFFAVTGATIGLFLSVMLLVTIFHRLAKAAWGVFGYSLTIIIYYLLMPDVLAYNLSFADFEASVMNRVLDESILVLNPELLLFMASAFMIVALFCHFRISKYLDLVAPLALVFGTVLLHNIVQSLLYSAMLGVAIGKLSELFRWPKIVLHPVN